MKKEKMNPAYPTWNEFNKKKFLNIATAVGIGVSAAAISLDLEAEEKRAVENKDVKKQEEVKKDKNKEMKDKIILLAANLGNKDYKERQKATTSLISMGQKFQKEKNNTMTCFLKTELEKSKNSKDPEVKKRANNILLAITAKPIRKHPPRLMGKIRRAGGMPAPK